MKKGALADWLLHLGGGLLIAVAFTAATYSFVWPAWVLWLSVPLALGLGVWREVWQHRDDRPVLTGHRVSEALAWGFGALAGASVGWFYLGLVAAR